MKRLLAALLAALLGVNHAAAEEEAQWTVAVGATRASDARAEGGRIVYRYRSGFERSFKRAAYPDRVIIAWPYHSADGLPSQADRETMDRLERLLTPGVEPISVLVLVSTGDGLREWVYYTRSQEAFMDKLNEALQDQPRFPVQIDLWKDPAWAFYQDFLGGLKQ